jgi:hypothetical protein
MASADQPLSGRSNLAEPESTDASETASGAPQMTRSESTRESESLLAADADEDEDEEARRGNTDARISRASQNEAQVMLAERQSNIDAGGDGASRETPRSSEGIAAGRSIANERTQVAQEIPGTEGTASSDSGGARMNRSRTDDATQLAMRPRDDANGRASLPSESTMEVEAARAESTDSAARGDDRSRPESPQSKMSADRMAGSQRIERNTIEGPSGLGDTPSLDAGLPTRPAVRESASLQFESTERFQRESRVEAPSARTDAVAAKEAFKDRGPESSSGGPSTEPSIELGLQFLARFQKGDGRWALEDFDRSHSLHVHQMRSDAAATGLALLAFQGAGYNHREFKYAAAVARAIDWLIEHQDAEGCFYVSSDEKSDATCRLYSHAIATLALTEAYGMTQDSRLAEPCRRGLAYIVRTQDPRRGGWRYYAETQKRQSDTSVTGWMMMAMQSGRLAGFDTPDTTWRRISDWLDLARDSRDEGRFRYNPFAPEDRDYQSAVSPAMTGVGVLMRLYTGWTRDDARVISASDYMLKALPSQDSSLVRDTYYWYYATQVLRHVGGDRWDRWNLELHPLLVESQTKTGELAGSWDPYGPVPDRWGHVGGRLYVTTMNLLSLEVDYRLLPLYERTTR